MEDAECAESKEKSNFRFFRFLFFRVMVIFVLKTPQFSIHFHDNSKNKNQKIDFLSDSTHCASLIKTGIKLRGGGVYIVLFKKKTKDEQYVLN